MSTELKNVLDLKSRKAAEEEEAMKMNSRYHLREMSDESLSSNPPRANCHAAHSLVDLGSAFALSFLFDEFLRNEELGS